MEVIAIAVAIGVPMGTLVLGAFTFWMTRRNGERVARLELDRDIIIRQLKMDLDTCVRERTRYADLLARELARGSD
jgi:hypothetical protein